MKGRAHKQKIKWINKEDEKRYQENGKPEMRSGNGDGGGGGSVFERGQFIGFN